MIPHLTLAGHVARFRWIAGLALGKLINQVAYRLLDAGWGLMDHSAQRWARPEFFAPKEHPHAN